MRFRSHLSEVFDVCIYRATQWKSLYKRCKEYGLKCRIRDFKCDFILLSYN